MSTIVEKLTAQSSGGSAELLNNIVKELWPNINVAVGQMIKDMVEPMFKTTLPGPLSSLYFTKIDLGPVPMQFSNATTTKVSDNVIKLDLNIDWESNSDIELDGELKIALGVERIKLSGRLEILLSPITNVLPLVGAAQFAFVNPPVLSLDFTGAADIADLSLVKGTVHSTILSTLNSMVTLPNRYLYRLDTTADFFKMHQYPLGKVRVTVEKAWGFSKEASAFAQRLLAKITREAPDCYANVNVGGEKTWTTSIISNTHNPTWNETHEFVLSDFRQCITFDVKDSDINEDDDVGLAVTTVEEILKNGGKLELPLTVKGEETPGRLAVTCEFFKRTEEANSLSSSDHKEKGRLSGIATVLISGAYGIEGQQKDLKPSVIATWGHEHRLQTAIIADAPGIDTSNPAFDQPFQIPILAEVMGSGPKNFRLALMNGAKEIGAKEVPFTDVTNAPGMKLVDNFDVGNGAKVRASISIHGFAPGDMQQQTLPDRTK